MLRASVMHDKIMSLNKRYMFLNFLIKFRISICLLIAHIKYKSGIKNILSGHVIVMSYICSQSFALCLFYCSFLISLYWLWVILPPLVVALLQTGADVLLASTEPLQQTPTTRMNQSRTMVPVGCIHVSVLGSTGDSLWKWCIIIDLDLLILRNGSHCSLYVFSLYY